MRRVNNLMARFSEQVSDRAIDTDSDTHNPEPLQTTEAFMVISAKDIVTSLNALCPQRRPASVASDSDDIRSGVQSSASSVSGFSLFRNAKVSDGPSESLNTVPSDLQDINIAAAAEHNLNSGNDQLWDCARVREACTELEELTANQTSTSNELWDVLYCAPASTSLCTVHERSMQISIAEDIEDHGSRLSSTRPPRGRLIKEYFFLPNTIEKLLHEHDVALASECQMPATSTNVAPMDASVELEQLFDQAIKTCQAQSDFVQAHWWFQQLHYFRSNIVATEDMTTLRRILDDIERKARVSTRRSIAVESNYETGVHLMSPYLQSRHQQLGPIIEEHERLRDKMWYVADARASAPYDDARTIASALRIMGKPKRSQRNRLSPPLRHWSGSKLSSTSPHLKTEAQVLEFLSAKPEHGGPNKLSDDQSKAVELWMDRQNIDNLCKGEERIQKLCMEVRKCVDALTATAPIEHSTIWSNALFARDTPVRQQTSSPRRPPVASGLGPSARQPNFLSLQTNVRSNETLSSASHALSSMSSQDCLDARSPTLTTKSSIPFWSPAMTEAEAPSSATSMGSSRTQPALALRQADQTRAPKVPSTSSLDRFRQRTTSLVLSDLTTTLYSDGSETDRAFWTGLGWELTDRYFRGLQAFNHAGHGSQTPRVDVDLLQPEPTLQFDFEGAFATLLQKFSATCNPSKKLALLHELDRLLVPYMAEQVPKEAPATSLIPGGLEHASFLNPTKSRIPAETTVAGFRRIFAQSSLRPQAIFRDLQFIAALLPSSVLHNTPEGKAFANAAVAISGLKQEARTVMVETADSIIAFHSNNRGHGRSSSSAQRQRDSATFAAPSRTPSAEDVSRYSMADAAYLLQIAAREGDHVAQRELGTLYLTHPELMDRIIAPFARPKDVFKEELEGKWRKHQDPNRLDPTTMCVAHHWMSLSSKGGNALAKEILKQREEMDSI